MQKKPVEESIIKNRHIKKDITHRPFKYKRDIGANLESNNTPARLYEPQDQYIYQYSQMF